MPKTKEEREQPATLRPLINCTMMVKNTPISQRINAKARRQLEVGDTTPVTKPLSTTNKYGIRKLRKTSSSSAQKKKINKEKWIQEEDELLKELAKKHGSRRWHLVAAHFRGRTGRTAKQCRERYRYQLHPHVRKGPWSKEEELTMREAHSQVGNKWSLIALRLPGRTDNAVKNYWHSRKKKLEDGPQGTQEEDLDAKAVVRLAVQEQNKPFWEKIYRGENVYLQHQIGPFPIRKPGVVPKRRSKLDQEKACQSYYPEHFIVPEQDLLSSKKTLTHGSSPSAGPYLSRREKMRKVNCLESETGSRCHT